MYPLLIFASRQSSKRHPPARWEPCTVQQVNSWIVYNPVVVAHYERSAVLKKLKHVQRRFGGTTYAILSTKEPVGVISDRKFFLFLEQPDWTAVGP
jgi:hypothetical protein